MVEDLAAAASPSPGLSEIPHRFRFRTRCGWSFRHSPPSVERLSAHPVLITAGPSQNKPNFFTFPHYPKSTFVSPPATASG
jgi:hypothetical protein